MYLKLRGDDIPAELLEYIPLLTDHARLMPGEVHYDPQNGEVRIAIIRFPLLKRRKVLPSKYDFNNPRHSLITVRNVHSCDIHAKRSFELEDEVQLMFGVRYSGDQMYLCSAEEEHGQPCYSITMAISSFDLEIVDLESESD